MIKDSTTFPVLLIQNETKKQQQQQKICPKYPIMLILKMGIIVCVQEHQLPITPLEVT